MESSCKEKHDCCKECTQEDEAEREFDTPDSDTLEKKFSRM